MLQAAGTLPAWGGHGGMSSVYSIGLSHTGITGSLPQSFARSEAAACLRQDSFCNAAHLPLIAVVCSLSKLQVLALEGTTTTGMVFTQGMRWVLQCVLDACLAAEQQAMQETRAIM